MKALLLILLISLTSLSLARADEAYKYGLGLIGIGGNQYRGSDQTKAWIFPLPYISYKTENIEIESTFFKGTLYKHGRFAFNVSVMAGLNVDSQSNNARRGMPTLDYTGEAGFEARYTLWKSDDESMTLNFECPIREVFSTNLKNLVPIDYFTTPYLNFIFITKKSNFRYKTEISMGPMYAGKKVHAYYYDVAPNFALADRPAYSSKGGYSGFQNAWVNNIDFEHIGIINFFRWDLLNGAVFQSSPLVKEKHYLIGGLGVYWKFH
jgi:outer membrane protein